MTPSKIKWHVRRDNRVQLAKFCHKNRLSVETGPVYTSTNGVKYFNQEYNFDNLGFITVQLLAGTEQRGYTVADCFDILDYGVGL